MKFYSIISILALTASCTSITFEACDEYPHIFPDYIGVTVPSSMSELRFCMADGRKFSKCERRVGDTLFIEVCAWEKGSDKGLRYKEFPIYVSDDEIDPYIAYRLIEPGYESWSNMGIYQRELSTFRERAIVTNRANGRGCVNCHSFDAGNPSRMLFHARGAGGGTVFIDGDKTSKVNLSDVGVKMQGTYPAWHPDGRYVVFSSNITNQCFTLFDSQPIEVYDSSSDIIFLDMESGETFTYPSVSRKDCFETFPSWSTDGKTLYYCCADSVEQVASNRGRLRYRIMAAYFSDGKISSEPRIVWEDPDHSASFPRANGDWLLFTRSDFATFPIWHKEADLWLLNMVTGLCFEAEALNSQSTESYHSWSSNGRWLVFSSRRLDDRYTRLFISHFDTEGGFTKPFLLPQEDPEHGTIRLKSYNIPEFIKGDASGREKRISELF